MKRNIFTVLVILMAALVLSGCSGSKVSEKQIRSDIIANDSFIYSDGFTIRDYTESQHEVNKKNGREIVRVLATTENEFVTLSNQYDLLYTKYNNGWRMDYFDADILSYEAKDAVNSARIKQDIQNVYGEMLEKYQFTQQQFGEVEVLNEALNTSNSRPFCAYRIPFTGRNDTAQTDGHLVVAYEMRVDTGWNLVSGVHGYNKYKTELKTTALTGPEDAVNQFMAEEGMESYEIVSAEKISDEEYRYEVMGADTDGSKYTTKYFKMTFKCEFDDVTGWEITNDRKVLADADLHLEGTWLYDDGTGENRYEIRISEAEIGQITMSYDIVITTYADGTYVRSSDGEMTSPFGVRSYDLDELNMMASENIAGPADTRSTGRYIRLVFYSYGDERYDESGIWLNGFQLTKIS